MNEGDSAGGGGQLSNISVVPPAVPEHRLPPNYQNHHNIKYNTNNINNSGNIQISVIGSTRLTPTQMTRLPNVLPQNQHQQQHQQQQQQQQQLLQASHYQQQHQNQISQQHHPSSTVSRITVQQNINSLPNNFLNNNPTTQTTNVIINNINCAIPNNNTSLSSSNDLLRIGSVNINKNNININNTNQNNTIVISQTVVAPTAIPSTGSSSSSSNIDNEYKDLAETSRKRSRSWMELQNSLTTTSFTTTTTISTTPTTAGELLSIKKRILEHKFSRLKNVKDKYSEYVEELFFLRTDSNMMEYQNWKKKPQTPQFLHFIKSYRLDPPPLEDTTATTNNLSPKSTTLQQKHQQQQQLLPSSSTTTTTATSIETSSPFVSQLPPISIQSNLSPSTLQYSPASRTSNTLHSQQRITCQSSSIAQIISTNTSSSTPLKSTSSNTSTILSSSSSTASISANNLPHGAEIKIPGVGVTPVACSTTLPAAVFQLTQQGGTPIVPDAPRGGSTINLYDQRKTTSPSVVSSSIQTITQSNTVSGNHNSGSIGSAGGTSGANSSNGGGGVGAAQEQYSLKARQEVYVMQRISELQREGLWTEKRLPKLQEPQRPKAHWDYLLEEMVWLATDFAQERKWKKSAAKKCAKMVQKHFQEKAIACQKAEKAQEIQLKRIASFLGKEVKIFWSNVEKLVEHKQQTKLEEKRKKALDQHLSFIVDQTEKFSMQLAEGMNKPIGANSAAGLQPTTDGNLAASTTPSLNSSRKSSPKPYVSDDEFSPGNASTDDDEETIAKAEAEATDVNAEVAALQKESEMDMASFLSKLPENYLENRGKIVLSGDDGDQVDEDVEDYNNNNNDNAEDERDHDDDNEQNINLSNNKIDEPSTIQSDTEFHASGDSNDDEDTIKEQEKTERKLDHKKEIEELNADNNMSLEELMIKYTAATPPGTSSIIIPPRKPGRPCKNVEIDSDDDDSSSVAETSFDEDQDEDNDDDDDDDDTSIEENSDNETDEEFDSFEMNERFSLKTLMEDNDDESGDGIRTSQKSQSENDDLINDAAAIAESIQPKGNTLSSTNVVTPIPFLLRHSLREYQHIGLDWLVTMHDRKLNGILADEMGLGKTIQTIALLAHLACVKGNWGPHLIVVPSSVMLNWEMEFKKWCPGFKILTYYGTQKERKCKRIGWTKVNAFHICITSYKLVIQDHQSFRRKKWKYLILDEAQNIKNFKSQRWQLLLNFSTEQRLLLTGTPLQNNLMELWSLMHFLMPHVFQSHREFKEWFSNPMSGMIEGNSEYNESIIKRLHKVLRPFLLRRLKSEVEKQMPKKYERVIMCRLSKRQRYLYEDFMSRAKTKETLESGNLLSVMNVLMQLRKVCNHPNMFEVRPIISPFRMEGVSLHTPSLVYNMLNYDPYKHIDLNTLNLVLIQLEDCLTAYVAYRSKKLQTPKKLIEEIDQCTEENPKCPIGKFKMYVRIRDSRVQENINNYCNTNNNGVKVGTSPAMKTEGTKLIPIINQNKQLTSIVSTPPPIQSTIQAASPMSPMTTTTMTPLQSQMVTIPSTIITSGPTSSSSSILPYLTTIIGTSSISTSLITTAGTTAIPTTQLTNINLRKRTDAMRIGGGGGGVGGIGTTTAVSTSQQVAQLLQSSTGRHIILTPSTSGGSTTMVTQSGQRLTVVKSAIAPRNATIPLNKSIMKVTVQPSNTALTPLTTTTSLVTSAISTSTAQHNVQSHNQQQQQPLAVALAQQFKNFIYSSGNISGNFGLSSPVLTSISSQSQSASRTGTGSVSVSMPTSSTRIPKSQQIPNIQNINGDFLLSERIQLQKERRLQKLKTLANNNQRKIDACPIYGSDLRASVFIKIEDLQPCINNNNNNESLRKNNFITKTASQKTSSWFSRGYQNCKYAIGKRDPLWSLTHSIKSYEERISEMQTIFNNFVIYVPAVSAPEPYLHVSHPHPSKLNTQNDIVQKLKYGMSTKLTALHPIMSGMSVQFPDPRLIQYDCGKLQTLDRLLRKLKNENHRVLIFTQMTRMLDILEAFLNYHGHIYLRLDGTTRIEQRQILMDRFNNDRRIFTFILSTRSGGVGVNLTGADTVIFYDSDWNPTMDAQAQDRCHRIGQTRDVHIYRLVSEKTIEENILKKANQKRLLGDLAIEGGNFTTAYFKNSTIQDLFTIDTVDDDSTSRLSDVLDRDRERRQRLQENLTGEQLTTVSITTTTTMTTTTTSQNTNNVIATSSSTITNNEEKTAICAFESALAAAEDEQDVQATKIASDEAAADLAEFDESIPIDDNENKPIEMSKAEQEVENLIKQLSPIERYAMRFVEQTGGSWTAAQLVAAEAEIEQQKREWEANRLATLKKEEEEAAAKRAIEEEHDLLTYNRADADNQVNNNRNNTSNFNNNNNSKRKQNRCKSFSNNNNNKNKRVKYADTNTKQIRFNRCNNNNNNNENNIRKRSVLRGTITNSSHNNNNNAIKTNNNAITNKHQRTIMYNNKPLSPPSPSSHSSIKRQKLINNNNANKLKTNRRMNLNLKRNRKLSKSPRLPPIATKRIRKNNKYVSSSSSSSDINDDGGGKCKDDDIEDNNVRKRGLKRNNNIKPSGGGGGGESNDSECSLEVMASTTGDDEQSSKIHGNTSVDEHDGIDENEDEENYEDDSNEESGGDYKEDDSKDVEENDSADKEDEDDDSDDSDSSEKIFGRKKITNLNSKKIIKRKESIENRLDVNSPRTRSRGTVKLNLWTLDISPILPDLRTKTRKNAQLINAATGNEQNTKNVENSGIENNKDVVNKLEKDKYNINVLKTEKNNEDHTEIKTEVVEGVNPDIYQGEDNDNDNDNDDEDSPLIYIKTNVNKLKLQSKDDEITLSNDECRKKKLIPSNNNEDNKKKSLSFKKTPNNNNNSLHKWLSKTSKSSASLTSSPPSSGCAASLSSSSSHGSHGSKEVPTTKKNDSVDVKHLEVEDMSRTSFITTTTTTISADELTQSQSKRCGRKSFKRLRQDPNGPS